MIDKHVCACFRNFVHYLFDSSIISETAKLNAVLLPLFYCGSKDKLFQYCQGTCMYPLGFSYMNTTHFYLLGIRESLWKGMTIERDRACQTEKILSSSILKIEPKIQ